MATRNVLVTADPTNLVATHSLRQGVRYALQNVDSDGTIYLRLAAVKPNVRLLGHIIRPGEFGYPSPKVAGVGIWIWTTPNHAPLNAVITEAD